jgi:hypothetical protein
MPQSIVIAAFVFGAVLLLIALLGGHFKIFGAEISGATGRPGRIIAGVVGVVLLVVGLFGGLQELPLKAPEKVEDLSSQQRTQKQVELEDKLQKMSALIENQGSQAGADSDFNIGGRWQNPTGLSYIIQQSGDTVVLQEIHPVYGVTAVGQGKIQGQSVEVNYITLVGTSGRADLQISADGKSITGSASDLSTGMNSPMNMYR